MGKSEGESGQGRIVNVLEEVTPDRINFLGEVLTHAIHSGGFTGGDIHKFSVGDLVVVKRMIDMSRPKVSLSRADAYVSSVIGKMRDSFAMRLLEMRIPHEVVNDYLSRVYSFEPDVFEAVDTQVTERLEELGAGHLCVFEDDNEEASWRFGSKGFPSASISTTPKS
ncbi:hypothetical protein HZC20_00375 [Candidatus Peregrinibacteria bacterium]|nr:hypothetical protein [Candidatus Peregrinibacteria bacterium]